MGQEISGDAIWWQHIKALTHESERLCVCTYWAQCHALSIKTSQPMALHKSFYRFIDPWNMLDEAPVHFCGRLDCAVPHFLRPAGMGEGGSNGICPAPSRWPVRHLLAPKACQACIYHQTTAAAQQAHTEPYLTDWNNWFEWLPHTGLEFGVSCSIFSWPDKLYPDKR